MKYLLLFLLSCTSIPKIHWELEPCGSVDKLEVFIKQYGLLSCKEAMEVTKFSYDILSKQAAGPLTLAWRVEYTWGSIGIDDPVARIFPDTRLIQVQSSTPRSVFHEMLHAYMFEHESGGRDQHRTMCANKRWRELESEVEVRPYCHTVRPL